MVALNLASGLPLAITNYPFHILGLRGVSKALLLSKLADRGPLLVLTADQSTAESLLEDLQFTLGPTIPQLFPAWDTLPFEQASPLLEVSAQRVLVLRKLLDNSDGSQPQVIVTWPEAIIQKQIPPSYLQEFSIEITSGSQIARHNIQTQLLASGYTKKPLVEELGDFALRGAVLDIFTPACKLPIRIDLIGSKVERIRFFEVESQRTSGETDRILITPVSEALPLYCSTMLASSLPRLLETFQARAKELECVPRETEQLATAFTTGLRLEGLESLQFMAPDTFCSFFEYLSSATQLVIDNNLAVDGAITKFWEEVDVRAAACCSEQILHPAPSDVYLGEKRFQSELQKLSTIFFDSVALASQPNVVDSGRLIVQSATNIDLVNQIKHGDTTDGALAPLKRFIKEHRASGARIGIVVGAKPRAKRLQRLLQGFTLDAPIITSQQEAEQFASDESHAVSNWINQEGRWPLVILPGRISAGVQLPDEKLVLVSESEVFSDRSKSQQQIGQAKLKRLMNSIAQLHDGNYIVHIDYGIGIYHGLIRMMVEGVESDFIHIEYADSRLYLPIQQIGKIQKFVAAEGSVPKIDKLGSTRWKQTKFKVQQSVISIAGDLIRLYAARDVAQGWRFEPVGAEDERFADGFPYTETPDQLTAIKETLNDMASDKPMDRLICGDVGFGKTEVAIRAAFKCIQHSRQVGVLVPTTVLAEQHLRSFRERFMEYPVRIEAVSRFRAPKENKDILAALERDEVDIVIGTHRLLQRDVQFKDLGLLIIDEEHRFGVKQKERLKQLKRQVDVLTLTATPIPRTLHMALLGIRDITVIATPPADRRKIRTHVASMHEGIIRDAILREIQRGGQVFYLHNRIQGIELICNELKELVPEARFRFAHGQMSEGQLEEIMRDFINKEFDVLISTTIIESGIDIPNANTIIIERADTLGLAQLYQLRGRVGRSDRQAYAYLLVPRTGKLTREAHQRLLALQSLDELGVGFNLAMQDLEIRGVGNLLGREQHGNVAAIGFELYTRILREAVMNVRGEQLAIEEYADPEVKLGVPAFIPEEYIPDISERLILYQRMAAVSDSLEVDQLRDEVIDRFGQFGDPVYNLLEVMRLRALLRHFGAASAEFSRSWLAISFLNNAPLEITKIMAATTANPDKLRFTKNLTLSIKFPFEEITDPGVLFEKVSQILRGFLRATSVISSTSADRSQKSL